MLAPRHFRISIAFLLASIFAATTSAQTEGPPDGDRAEDPSSPQRVLIISCERTSEFSLTLTGALQAHLADSRAIVHLAQLDDIPADRVAQAEMAMEAAREDMALAVAWLDPHTSAFFLMVLKGDGSEQVVERTIQTSESALPTVCDGLAAMVRSALSPFLRSLPTEEPEPKPAAAEPAAAPTEEPPEEPEPTPPTTDPALRRLSLLLELGYQIAVVSSDKNTQHGLDVCAGLAFLKHFDGWVRYNVLFPIEATGDTNGADLKLHRRPLSFGLGAFLPHNDLVLGIRAGLILDFTELQGFDSSGMDPDTVPQTDHVNPGFIATPYVRYRIVGPVAVWLSASVTIYRNAYDYEMNNQTVLSEGSLKAFFAGGIAIVPVVKK